MAMDQKLVAGAGGAGIVFLAVVFLAILSSRGGRENLEDIQFLRRYVLNVLHFSEREREFPLDWVSPTFPNRLHTSHHMILTELFRKTARGSKI